MHFDRIICCPFRIRNCESQSFLLSVIQHLWPLRQKSSHDDVYWTLQQDFVVILNMQTLPIYDVLSPALFKAAVTNALCTDCHLVIAVVLVVVPCLVSQICWTYRWVNLLSVAGHKSPIIHIETNKEANDTTSFFFFFESARQPAHIWSVARSTLSPKVYVSVHVHRVVCTFLVKVSS